ncbi:transposase [Paracoccus sp. S-4012]|nr:transposase [Paracoccus sp. S-4012]
MSDGASSFTEEQMSRLAPLLPRDTRGVPRVDDRRVISGIVHVLRALPLEERAALLRAAQDLSHNRFVGRAQRGVISVVVPGRPGQAAFGVI